MIFLIKNKKDISVSIPKQKDRLLHDLIVINPKMKKTIVESKKPEVAKQKVS